MSTEDGGFVDVATGIFVVIAVTLSRANHQRPFAADVSHQLESD